MIEDSEYGLVMPFVVCASKGGPYADESFVAGVRFGEMTMRLEAGETPVVSYEPPALVPQFDLLAMHCGYRLTSEPWDEHPDDWSLVTFTKDPS